MGIKCIFLFSFQINYFVLNFVDVDVTLAWYKDWSDLFKNILWSDEAVFHIGGFVNRHNCHYWAGEDPCITSEKNAELVCNDFGQDCGSLYPSRCCECGKLSHYAERGNLASYQYLGEYSRFNIHVRWRSSTL